MIQQGYITYTNLIILVTVVVSFVAYDRRDMFNALSFYPYSIKRNRKEIIRFITCAFVHADFFHLLFNMLVLYMFGNALERYFKADFESRGIFYYSLLYFGGAAFAGIYGFYRHRDNQAYMAVGASGAISALVFAFIVLMPTAHMGLMFIPVRIPALYFGIVYLLIEFLLDKRGGTGIAHDAHFWGSVFGICFILLINPDNVSRFWIQAKTLF